MNIIAVIMLCISVFQQEGNCQCTGNIGTKNETAFIASRENRFYLNTAAPATCGGTITDAKFCYYKPSNIDNEQSFFASLAIYRQKNSTTNGSVAYEKASDMFNISLTGRQVNVKGDFVCTTVAAVDFDVEVGDVIGACVFDPTGSQVRQLDIVGEADGYSLMETMDNATSSYCHLNSIPSTILSSQLSTISSRILHVHAHITNPTYIPTSPSTSSLPLNKQVTSVSWTTTKDSPVHESIVDKDTSLVSETDSLSLEVITGVVVGAVLIAVIGTTIIVVAAVFFRSKTGNYSPLG